MVVSFTEMGNSINGGEFQNNWFRHINFEILIARLWTEVTRGKHIVLIVYRWHENGCHHWGMVVSKRREEKKRCVTKCNKLKRSEGGWATKK